MKKLLLGLICFVLMLMPVSLAESELSGSLNMMFGTTPIAMMYDGNPEYSYVQDGCVTASFISEELSGVLFELYLCFPVEVNGGDVFSTEDAIAGLMDVPGVYLFMTAADNEVFAYASQTDVADPAGAHYELRFAEVSRDGDVASYAGTFSALLAAEDGSPLPGEVTGEFAFSIDLTAEPAIGDDPEQIPDGTEKEPQFDSPQTPQDTTVYKI